MGDSILDVARGVCGELFAFQEFHQRGFVRDGIVRHNRCQVFRSEVLAADDDRHVVPRHFRIRHRRDLDQLAAFDSIVCDELVGKEDTHLARSILVEETEMAGFGGLHRHNEIVAFGVVRLIGLDFDRDGARLRLRALARSPR